MNPIMGQDNGLYGPDDKLVGGMGGTCVAGVGSLVYSKQKEPPRAIKAARTIFSHNSWPVPTYGAEGALSAQIA